jgi:hypothetical protein
VPTDPTPRAVAERAWNAFPCVEGGHDAWARARTRWVSALVHDIEALVPEERRGESGE